MARIRNISTVNIKPANANTFNIRPQFVDTVQYAAYIDLDDANRYATFKYGAKKYGAGTEFSAGQKMPKISTVEV
jgi:hypothetical protein